MNASLLMGVVAGARSMTPLAAVAWLCRCRNLPNRGPVADFLSNGWVLAGATALAVGELLGDKMRSAPDRIVAPGMAARILTGGLAGAVLARDRDQNAGALLGAAAAVGSSYATFAARSRLMGRYGRRPTGVAEDALVLACTVWIATHVWKRRIGR